ncbi:hypothetical protein, partial [Rivihabitans pingtungensis]|uniref:hypothetical protein n=1 Tax=Rivihabitans pingtungensis TaxID=1054498 RepID=UPI002FD97E1D
AMAGAADASLPLHCSGKSFIPCDGLSLFDALSRVLGVGESVARRAWVVGGRPRDDKGSGK